MDLRVGLLEGRVVHAVVAGAAPGDVEHAGGQVDTERRAGRSGAHRVERGLPGAAADVEHAVVLGDRGGLE